MYRAIRRNRIATFVIIAVYLVIVAAVAVGLSLLFHSPWWGIGLGILAMIHIAWVWAGAARTIERMMKTHRVTVEEEPRLYHAVENLAIRNGMPMPAIGVDEETLDINAYAIGFSPKRAVVAASRGALNALDSVELEAIMAHEMSHIRNGDTRVKVLLFGLVGFFQLLAQILIIGGTRVSATSGESGGGSKKNSGAMLGGFLVVLGFVFMVLGYVIGPLVQNGVSRRRELLADASGVEMTRFIPGMVSAFHRMEAEDQTGASGPLAIFYTHRRARRGIAYLFTATHPPTWLRIEKLEEMEAAF